ncbi:MAG: phosphatidylinositol-specific phospholipase C/glycerophosphodiester phosphodiesterase family protein [Bacteroidetes bacterium]|nr:phosphatidylinositol-specific phospholipase C/glycerophosphodiester phosphodiesterase family protein [Bacteroidota bacterium]
MRNNFVSTRHIRTLLFLLPVLAQFTCKAQPTPVPNGFAHNDYLHKHPLFDALSNGFVNIEADIFLRGNKLVVAHVFPYFKSKKTLESLYFKPLYQRVTEHNGQVFANYSKPVILMIDIKTGAEHTYRVLVPLLEKYRSMLTRMENGKIIYSAVTVVLSGHKPYNLIEGNPRRLAFIDEDLRKISRDSAMLNLFPMASCKYSHVLSWGGIGPIPSRQRQRLRDYVAMAHELGSKVRLWASPENKAVWDELLLDGVDLINTDQLANLRKYLNSNPVVLAKAD